MTDKTAGDSRGVTGREADACGLPRDGFVISDLVTGEEVHFVQCSKGGSKRDRSFEGLLLGMDLERFGAQDTRDDEGDE